MVKQRSMTDISDQNTETGYMGLETQNDDMMPKTEDGDAKTKGMSGKLAVAVIGTLLTIKRRLNYTDRTGSIRGVSGVYDATAQRM